MGDIIQITWRRCCLQWLAEVPWARLVLAAVPNWDKVPVAGHCSLCWGLSLGTLLAPSPGTSPGSLLGTSWGSLWGTWLGPSLGSLLWSSPGTSLGSLEFQLGISPESSLGTRPESMPGTSSLCAPPQKPEAVLPLLSRPLQLPPAASWGPLTCHLSRRSLGAGAAPMVMAMP